MKQVDANKDKSDLRPEKAALTEANLEHQAKRQHSYLSLIEACKEKNLKRVECILSERPELVNHKDKHNRTLLHYSAILVQEPQNEEQQQQEQQDSSVACFDYLSKRCELKLWWQQDADGLSALHLAVISANLPLVRHLVFEHPNSIKYPLVYSLDNESHSPLHWAVITNNLDCARLLVEFGGTKLAHEPDLNGATPLHYSTQTRDYPKYRQQLKSMLRQAGSARTNTKRDHREASESILESFSFDEENETRETNPEKLQQEEETLGFNRRGLEILEFLVQLPEIKLECVDKDLRTPLLWAASSGNRDALLLLLASGANADTADINRLGALHCAASHGFTDCLECLLNQAAAKQRLELMVNQVDNLNCTPLFYSVLSGNIDCIETLLERGAQRDWQDSKGRTAAHFAALKGQLNSLKLLEARGANLWLANKQGDLPLHYAIKSGRQQVTKWLLEHSPYENTVNAINNFGRAPIHLAIVKNQPAMVEYLLSRGANLNQLVKVRDKQATGKRAQAQQTSGVISALVNNSTAHQAKNGLQYHYETALDMARNLNKGECLRLLRQHAALSAEQVIRTRGESQLELEPTSSGVAAHSNQQRSLFDLQSADGISPIGFETSCSSATPTSNSTRAPADSANSAPPKRQSTGTTSNTLGSSNFTPTGSSAAESSSSPAAGTRVAADEQQLPALPKRPAPDSLPQTDSTGSSALSQNSLASLRGPDAPQVELLEEEESQQFGGLTAQRTLKNSPQTSSNSTRLQRLGQAKQAASFRSIRDEEASEEDEDEEEARQPYEGGIGYNNQHVNASIKYKLYGDLRRPPFEQVRGGNSSFPPFQQPQTTLRRNGRGSLSAPTKNDPRLEESFSRAGGQEIITNVNVYTSPCAHCLHLQAEQCLKCGHKAKLATERADQAEAQAGCSISCSDEEDSATEEAADGSLSSANNSEQATQLAGGAARQRSFNASSSFRHQRPPLYQHLPPSQNHNQQLPVILSDQEQSHSAASERNNENAQTCARNEELQAFCSDEQPSCGPAAKQVNSEEGASCGRAKSPADQEPRFDRSERLRCRKAAASRQQRVKSPVAEYIHGSPKKSSPARGAAALSECRARPRARQHDYSQVRAKVDSHRAENDEWAWLGANSNARHFAEQQQPSRSVSRQTVLKESGTMTRRMSSEEDEAGRTLTSRLERSIRKYRQENKLFEELQKLKRSQIRSGRANEALLVKRLAEHFRHQAAYVDLIGLDTYRGPYTYKAYERFLYDQLRKLSQSNCAKLADRLSESLVGASFSGGNHQRSGLKQEQADFYSTANFMDDDLRADLELRRVIGGPEAENDSDFYESYAGHQSASGGQKQLSGVHADSKVETMNDALEEQSGVKEAERAKEASEQQLPAERQTCSSRSSSRRSSVEVEREKVQQLPLATKQQLVKQEESREKALLESELNNLSASIITDALGNVSRTNSPEPAQMGASVEQRAETSEAAEVTEPSVKSEKSVEEEEEEDSLTPLTRRNTRRRSVINIGNKMEVVYHDVGIEIDSVGDDKVHQARAERDEESGTEMNEAETGQQAAASCSDQDNANERHQLEASKKTLEQSELLSDVEEEHQEGEPNCLNTSESAQAAALSEEHPQSPVREHEDEVQQAVSQSKRSSLSSAQYRRRSSSPSTISAAEGSTTGRESLISAGRRRASIASELSALDSTAPTKELKRVFNGHDLDRLHEKRVSETDVRASKDDLEKVETKSSEPTALGAEESERKPESSIASQTRRANGSRLMRSRLPRGKYKVKVPLEDVKQRWRQIKAAERLKLGRDGQFEHVPVNYALSALSSEIEGKEADSEATDGVGGGEKLAKSQPNLWQVEESEVRKNREEASQTKQNYTLLYEVNKKLATGSTFGQGEKKSEKGEMKMDASKRRMTKVNWCHKKVVRIVDVRTLKRTLSLPDSLLYSNNLLKRFNILKL